MSKTIDRALITNNALLCYLERVCGVDIEAVREAISADTATARKQSADGARVNGLVYRFRNGYVTTVLLGDPLAVRMQTAAACKKIMRSSRKVPLLPAAGTDDADATNTHRL